MKVESLDYFKCRRFKMKRFSFAAIISFIIIIAYLNNLIQIESNRLIISMYGGGALPQHHHVIKSSSFNNNNKDTFSDMNLHSNENMQQILLHIDRDEDEYVKWKVSELFSQVDRATPKIKEMLSENELSDLDKQRQNLNMLLEKFHDEEVVASNETSAEKEKRHARPKQLLPVDIKKIKRSQVIKFLKSEKSKLKRKLEQNELISVKSIIQEKQFDNNETLLNMAYIDEDLWQDYLFNVNELGLTRNEQAIENILHTLKTAQIHNVSERTNGTQIKLILTFENGLKAVAKPMKVERDYETLPDHFYFNDLERHHAEIAAFHLDKVLGLYHVPPTIGRVLNISSEIEQLADKELAKTFYTSPAGNLCFIGHCSYYCDTNFPMCGKPFDKLENSIQLLLPVIKHQVELKSTMSPYRRSYSRSRKAEWELNENYCNERVFQDLTYHSKTLLDLMDLYAFDFLTGNQDRHHYERFVSFGPDTSFVHFDNGRAFGKAFFDDMSILAPIRQCCLFRHSTFVRLEHLYLQSGGFSSVLDESLKRDPLYPILTRDHLNAIDRRTRIIFKELSNCIIDKKLSIHDVIVDDGY